MTNKQKIKCLFGHHTYKEVWTQCPSSYIPKRCFSVCTICRDFGIYTSEMLNNRTGIIILLETKSMFLIRVQPDGLTFQLSKFANQCIGYPSPVKTDRGGWCY